MTAKTKPYFVMIFGAPGSGRSFFAEHFAEKFRAPLVDFDTVRSDVFVAPTFDHNETAQIIKLGENLLKNILLTGTMTLVEGCLDKAADRRKLAKFAEAQGYQPLLIWVQTDEKTIRARTSGKIAKAKLDQILAGLDPPREDEKPIVISGKHSFDTQVKVLMRQLSAQRAEAAKGE